jgi:hypothetical protein
MKKIVVVLLMTVTSASATIYQSDGSLTTVPSLPSPGATDADKCTAAQSSPNGGVQWLHDHCVSATSTEGDTITIPSGEFKWGTRLVISRAIILQGATFAGNVSTHAQRGTINHTIIHTLPGPSTGSAPLVHLDSVTGKKYRITGLKFLPATQATPPLPVPVPPPDETIEPDGQSQLIRIDNCWFDNDSAHTVQTRGRALGVVDHCSFVGKQSAFHFDSGGFGGLGFGDGAYQEPPNWGSWLAWYIEDCHFQRDTIDTHRNAADGNKGGMAVIRHCTLVNMAIGNHGNEGAGNQSRSFRKYEVYDNSASETNVNAIFVSQRGGNAIVCDNAITGPGFKYVYDEQNYRIGHTGIAVGANGTNKVDQNYNGDGSIAPPGSPGTPYFVGTADAGSGPNHLVQNDHTWGPGTLRGYSLHNPATGKAATILANTEQEITDTMPNQHGSDVVTFTVDQEYKIYRCKTAIDMAGAGQDQDPAVRINDLLQKWPNQTPEATYIWGNTKNGNPFILVNLKTPFVKLGEHVINDGTHKPGYTKAPYPHFLVSPTTGKVISLSGNMAFGNVIVGDPPPESDLTVRNTGSDLLTVSNVSYPTAFTGPSTGFTLAGGAQRIITVRFTPTALTTYVGDITVTSNADNGPTNTIAVSGRGVQGPIIEEIILRAIRGPLERRR